MQIATGWLRTYPRLFGSLALGALAGALTPGPPETRLLIGCASAASLFVAAMSRYICGVDPAGMRRKAARQDVAPWLILVIALITALVGLFAIIAHMKGVAALGGWEKVGAVALALWAIAAGWAMTHLAFALHYAHEFWRPGADGKEGGLDFPGCDEPDYWDFLYFAFVIGVAAQTADVSISSRALRRVALAHGVIAFFYNLAILGLFVNVAAGLV